MGRGGNTHWVEGHWVDRSEWDRAPSTATPQMAYIYRPRLTYETFNRPTKCRYCGEEVFFYKSPYGGMVFFNLLQPPWDKHDCIGYGSTKKEYEPTYKRQVMPAYPPLPLQAWNSIRIEDVYREDSWYVLKCKQLKDERLLRVLVPSYPNCLQQVPAGLGEWSENGFAILSYIDDFGDEQRLTVCKYSDYCLSESVTVEFPSVNTLRS